MSCMDNMDKGHLLDNLRYDQETGLFWWAKPGVGRKMGKPCGTKHKYGYILLNVNRVSYRAHRVAFLLMGEDIPEVVDHINGVKDDNRWVNLRPSCYSTNQFNSAIKSNNKSGFKGVHYCERSKKYIAKVVAFKKTYNLGYYDCPKEAHKAYLSALETYHGGYANYENIKR